jgi:hypothetical protein
VKARFASHVTPAFRQCLKGLPAHVRWQARFAYRLFAADPRHPSLHFKQIHHTRPIYSARVGIGYRAIAVLEGRDLYWYWIGTHADYDRAVGGL